jgi:hypothetical protein
VWPLALDVGVGARISLKLPEPVQRRPIVRRQLAEVWLDARRIGQPLALWEREQIGHMHANDGVRSEAAELRRDV